MSDHSNPSPQKLISGANDAVANGDYAAAKDLFFAAIQMLTEQLGAEHADVVSLREDLTTLEEMQNMKEFVAEAGPDRAFNPSQITQHTPHGSSSDNDE
jgi:hypothetical protein